jgi:signal peptidase I
MLFELRRICHFTVGLLVAALFVRTWLVLGMIQPVIVSGSSMAPTLRGPHAVYVCQGCRSRFSIEFAERSEPLQAKCSNCGLQSAQLLALAAGDRIIVDRTTFWFHGPRRWQLVVFRCPQRADQFCVKRVVGLPGEEVALAAGDIYINGELTPYPNGNLHYFLRTTDRPQWVDERPASDFVWPFPPGPGRVAKWRLGADEYFVVGDSASISDDSRNWLSGPGLDAKLVIGAPFGIR